MILVRAEGNLAAGLAAWSEVPRDHQTVLIRRQDFSLGGGKKEQHTVRVARGS